MRDKLFVILASVLVVTLAYAAEFKQGSAPNDMVFLADSADHITGKTGVTPTIYLSKNGGAWATAAPSVTERGYGWYNLAWGTGHTDTLGDFAVHLTATGADPADYKHRIVTATGGDIYAELTNGTYGLSHLAKPGDVMALTGWTTQRGANLDNLDAAISSRLATAGYTAPDNASVTAIKAKTDQLVFTTPNKVDATATVAAADIWSVSVPGVFTAGQAGYILGHPETWGQLVLPAIQGTVYTAVAAQSREVAIVRGDSPRITFDLGADYTGWTIKFGAKAKPDDVVYVIAVKDGAWTNAALGQGYVDLTTTETAAVGRLYAEVELRSGASRLTAIKFVLRILEDVID